MAAKRDYLAPEASGLFGFSVRLSVSLCMSDSALCPACSVSLSAPLRLWGVCFLINLLYDLVFTVLCFCLFLNVIIYVFIKKYFFYCEAIWPEVHYIKMYCTNKL